MKNALLKLNQAEYFVFGAKWLKVVSVNSELESILLEARLIRLYQPKYNLMQKDDKSELYVVVSKSEYPEITLIRGSDLTGKEKVYGPFMSAKSAEQIMRIARRVFRICSNPPKRGKRNRACFYYHIRLCDGVCIGKVEKRTYRKRIGYLKKFLGGQVRQLLKELLREIREAAQKKDFELASKKRDLYEALYHVVFMNTGLSSYLSSPTENQVKSLRNLLILEGIETSLERIEAYDIATLQQKDTVGSMVVFYLGSPQKSQYRKFRIRGLTGGDPTAMAEMLRRRFRHSEWELPSLVLLDGGVPQLSVAGSEIPEEIPRIGLAKKEEIVIVPKINGGYKMIELSKRQPALKLLQNIRDEAHRFATTYHKKVRDRRRLE